MALAPINPTQITPPRVEFIDPRSGAISREWYRFFLSLRNATLENQEETMLAPDTAALLATYDAMLMSATQTSAIASDGMVASLESSLNSLQNTFSITPPDLGGTVTTVSVVSANGFAGTVANPTTTPAITLTTSVTGLVKGNGTALSAAIAGTDYVAPSAYASTNGLTMATNRLLGRTTASTGAAEEISVAGGLTLSAGVLTGTSGTVTSVTATAPVVSSGGATPNISMAAATASVNGYLTSADWTTFNSKGSGSVTSVGGTGTVNGITLTGTVTSSGNLTLGGTLSGVNLTSQVTGTLPVANGGTGTATAFTAGSVVFAGASGTYSQDNVNLFWDDTNDRLGIGTAAPTASVHIVDQNNAGFRFTEYNNSEGATFRLSAARGTVASPAALTTDSVMFGFRGFGYTSAGAFGGATVQINGRAAENFTSTAQGTYLTFITTPTGSTSAAERMRIDAAGNVGIGATANASAILDVQSTTKGFRLPNMTTTQKNAVSSPAAGLMVFDTTLAKACVYSGAAWQTITSV